MNEDNEKKLNKTGAWVALGLFVATCLAIISIHSFPLGFGLKITMSISKYVGLALWSVIVFTVSNLIITWAWIRYAREVAKKWKLSKAWLAMAIIAAIGLVVLSFCPIDFYDAVPGEHGVVSIIHMISSRTMFVMMIMTSIGLFMAIKKRGFRIYTAAYILYGLAMALMFAFGSGFFWSMALPFESLFIFGYLVVLCLIPKE